MLSKMLLIFVSKDEEHNKEASLIEYIKNGAKHAKK